MSSGYCEDLDKSASEIELGMKIIEHVRHHPILWNTSHPYFKDKIGKERAWQSISQILKIDDDMVKGRWHSLRHRFSRERKKAKMNGEEVQWLFYPYMEFINKFVLERRPKIPSYFKSYKTLQHIAEKTKQNFEKNNVQIITETQDPEAENSTIPETEPIYCQPVENITNFEANSSQENEESFDVTKVKKESAENKANDSIDIYEDDNFEFVDNSQDNFENINIKGTGTYGEGSSRSFEENRKRNKDENDEDFAFCKCVAYMLRKKKKATKKKARLHILKYVQDLSSDDSS